MGICFFAFQTCTKLQKLLIGTSLDAILSNDNVLAALDEKTAIEIIAAAVDGMADKVRIECIQCGQILAL